MMQKLIEVERHVSAMLMLQDHFNSALFTLAPSESGMFENVTSCLQPDGEK